MDTVQPGRTWPDGPTSWEVSRPAGYRVRLSRSAAEPRSDRVPDRCHCGNVRLTIELGGPASDEDHAGLKRQVDEHCPVLDLFRNPTPTTTSLA
jgi:hypothetical protein